MKKNVYIHRWINLFMYPLRTSINPSVSNTTEQVPTSFYGGSGLGGVGFERTEFPNLLKHHLALCPLRRSHCSVYSLNKSGRFKL